MRKSAKEFFIPDLTIFYKVWRGGRPFFSFSSLVAKKIEVNGTFWKVSRVVGRLFFRYDRSHKIGVADTFWIRFTRWHSYFASFDSFISLERWPSG